jgi:hypothetical protein
MVTERDGDGEGRSVRVQGIFWTVVILASLDSGQARAMTAEDLLRLCKEPVSQGYCEGYIAGFYDGRTTSDYGKPELMSCPPTDSTDPNQLAVSYSQMVRVFTKWAEEHPEKLHLADWQALREALAQAWPCKP